MTIFCWFPPESERAGRFKSDARTSKSRASSAANAVKTGSVEEYARLSLAGSEAVLRLPASGFRQLRARAPIPACLTVRRNQSDPQSLQVARAETGRVYARSKSRFPTARGAGR